MRFWTTPILRNTGRAEDEHILCTMGCNDSIAHRLPFHANVCFRRFAYLYANLNFDVTILIAFLASRHSLCGCIGCSPLRFCAFLAFFVVLIISTFKWNVLDEKQEAYLPSPCQQSRDGHCLSDSSLILSAWRS
eukprot:6192485-Pleurochrysis_carterae.AAC.1